MGDNAYPSAGGWGVRYKTSLGDTTFVYVCGSSTTSSGVAVDNSFHRLEIKPAGAGKVQYALYDLAGNLHAGSVKVFCTAASGCDVNNVALPTASTRPTMNLRTMSSGAKSADLDFFGFRMRLNR
jgi:hypothetical protein